MGPTEMTLLGIGLGVGGTLLGKWIWDRAKAPDEVRKDADAAFVRTSTHVVCSSSTATQLADLKASTGGQITDLKNRMDKMENTNREDHAKLFESVDELKDQVFVKLDGLKDLILASRNGTKPGG